MPSDHLFLRPNSSFRRRGTAITLILLAPCLEHRFTLRSHYWTPPRAYSAAVDSREDGQATSFKTERNIDIKSLRNTLHAHREANRASIVRKTYGNGVSQPLLDPDTEIPPTVVPGHRHQRKLGAFKKIDVLKLAPTKRMRGTNRDLGALWKIRDVHKPPPLLYRLPWLLRLEPAQTSVCMSAADRLSAEIRAFEKYNSPTDEELQAAVIARQDLAECIHALDPNVKIEVIGSRATDTAEPLSDLDVNVVDPKHPQPSEASTNAAVTRLLRDLERVLRGQHPTIRLQFYSIEPTFFVRTARVPILVCRHKGSSLPIQIQCTPRTFDSTEAVKACLREYPSLRGLFKVLKQLLQMRGLTIGSHGGVTSYTLFNMIVAALRLSEGKFYSADAGKQLLFFLDMYSTIDFSSHGISQRPLELFSRKNARLWSPDSPTVEESPSSTEPYRREREWQRQMSLRPINDELMILQDLANSTNNLGASAYRIKDVQETFIGIRAKLSQAMAKWDSDMSASNRPHVQSRSVSLLEACIAGDYRLYEFERDDLRRFGRMFMNTQQSQDFEASAAH